jgi:phosphoglycerate kinase
MKTIKDVETFGKKVLVRVDFNVPLEDGEVADDFRIRAALPTIRYLIDHQARIILCSHLGRPKGKVVPELRLDPVADRLAHLLNKEVRKTDDCIGPKVEQAVKDLSPGEVLLLENTRFHPEEKANDADFAALLAGLADLYVNDAFAAAHRAHASTEGVTHFLPAVAGLLMASEVDTLTRMLEEPEHPFLVVLGGAKISDKIGAVDKFLELADTLLVGGGMANTFLKARGLEMGESLVEENSLDQARRLLDRTGEHLVLPVDAVVADAFAADAKRQTVAVDAVPAGWRILDVGPQTIELFKEKLAPARTVVWNGPLGVFEMAPFAAGTYALARALARSEAVTITGGGETAAAVYKAGVVEQMTHVSTGGGAFLDFVEGKTLPGLAALAP